MFGTKKIHMDGLPLGTYDCIDIGSSYFFADINTYGKFEGLLPQV